MTQRYGARQVRAHAQDILNRWCAIAERRLEHLIELYESGRWRRYHSENAFMENLREAKTVVETWRVLARREATPDNRAVDWSWLGRPAGTSSAAQKALQEEALPAAQDDAPAAEEPSSDAGSPTGIAHDPRDFHERYPMLRQNEL